MKRKIYLFRHGKTYYNQKGIFTGWKNIGITPTGLKDAKKVAFKLRNKKFQIAFYTKLKRSTETLKPVLKFHPECEKLIKDDRMIERSYGKLEGKKHTTFIEEIGKKDIKFLKEKGDALEDIDPKLKDKLEKLLGEAEYKAIHRGYNIRPPGGESFKDVEKRVRSFIKDLKKLMKKRKVNVAISAHGNSIRLFRKIMEKTSKKETMKWFIPYDNYYEYSIEV